MSKKQNNKKMNLLDSVDSDQDGLSDYEEIFIYGTDPNNPDTDGDGMSDGDEVRAGRNPKGPGLLKDLFIPHAGNKFFPHSLHPRRLAFHAFTAVLIKVIVIVFVISYPLEAWVTPDVLSEQSKKIIELTNQQRQRQNVPVLTESSLLDQAAYTKTQDMLINQYFDHFSPTRLSLADWLKKAGYTYLAAGENLAMGFGDASEVVEGWRKSSTHYANMIDKDFSEIGVGLVSGFFNGHQTTLVAEFLGQPSRLAKRNSPTNDLRRKEIAANKKNATRNGSKNKMVVLAQKIIQSLPLSQPILISPADNAIYKSGQLDLKVYAPGADDVVVYVDSKKNYIKNIAVADDNNDDLNYYNLPVNISPGRHQVMIKSIKNNIEKFSRNYALVIDNQPPEVNVENSQITVDQLPDPAKSLLKAEVFLSPDTASAQLYFRDNYIDLKPEGSVPNKWIAEAVVYQDQASKSDQNLIILPNVIARDYAGSTATVDVTWKKVTPIKTSVLKHYFFLRTHQSENIKKIFDISSWYYKILLSLFGMSLLLFILVDVRRQRPRAIASAIGLISLMLALLLI